MSQLEKVPSKQKGVSKCLQFKTKKHKKSYSTCDIYHLQACFWLVLAI